MWFLRNAGWVFFLTLLAWGGLMVAYDVVVLLALGAPATISWQVQQFARRNPIAPFLCCIPIGLLIVHFCVIGDLGWCDARQPVHAALMGLLVGGLGGYLWWLQRA